MTERTREEKIARFKQGEQWLRASIAGLSSADLDARPIPGEWSVREVVHHMADGEIIAAGRLRRMLAEDVPAMPGYDAGRFASDMNYEALPMDAALSAFAALRAYSANLIDNLTPEQWQRTGIHSEYGEQSVERWVEGNGNHVESHVGQIREIRAALGK
jgi:hypothetical protein